MTGNQRTPAGNGSSPGMARLIGPPLDLKRKGEALSFDEPALKRAEAVYSGFVVANANWCDAQVAKIADAYAAWSQLGAPSKAQQQTLYEHFHELRGLGSTFGYPMLTVVAESFCRYIEAHPAAETVPPVVRLHVDMLQVVLQEKLKGDGGELGRGLIAELHHAVSAAKAAI